ncbi:hypothetical protein [Vibrio algivorus]|uniref:Uncharacterized protein n=1 Tax=Vibrio algivorus TaxID=1667024 RepID=A0ABQ6EQB7_9VIBR|nr:hypothetical protein [Vibrio algivorus]GLT15353.1 hypothetical protein GCM10007931_23280 [Vibrio algivorus]
MNYSPLAIHCTSLCFDTIQSQDFDKLTLEEIEEFKQEIYWLLRERAFMWPHHYQREHEFLETVTMSIVGILTQCRIHRTARNTSWILFTLEKSIEKIIYSLVN